MKKIAVILSGCGFKDGSEVTESVSTLIALSRHEVEYQVYSLNQETDTTHHLSDEPLGKQNLLEASSRISRGRTKDLNELKSDYYDAIIFPGGYGAALHLCDFAKKGASCSVNPIVRKIITTFHDEAKPIGAFCIAPTLIGKVLGKHSPTMTIGDDTETANELEKMGAQHVKCKVTDYTSDRENKIISTPAYMYDSATPFEVFTGINNAINEIVEMA
jgi:enhancing lycopene biosynthesis protein 2